MNRVKTAAAIVATSAMLLAGCGSEGDEVRLAEPVLDFPYTSTSQLPEPEIEITTEEPEETTTSSTTSSSSSTSSSTSTRTSTSTSSTTRRAEPEPAPEPEPEPLPGAECAWPSQSEANGREFSTFCDREWARTMLDGQQYFWKARANGWASVDPDGTVGNDVCWARDDFNGAPEAIRNAAVYCTPAE